MIKLSSIVFLLILASTFVLKAQSKSSLLNVLYLNNELVDTMLLADSIGRNYLLQPLNETSNPIKVKKDKVFLMLPDDFQSQWVKFRFEDEFLVDDVFIHGLILAYNESYLLLKYQGNGEDHINAIHKSQIAVKDLKRLNLYKK